MALKSGVAQVPSQQPLDDIYTQPCSSQQPPDGIYTLPCSSQQGAFAQPDRKTENTYENVVYN